MIKEKMVETVNEAKRTGRLCYLYKKQNNFYMSFEHRKDWIFRAYPGGRMELSAKGSLLVTL